ncbi:MAG: putative motility protein [Planctomycetaceae bacterium]|jgi:hypothetical protein|nr:putative motility protein [Planctomycetaceae bacterium]
MDPLISSALQTQQAETALKVQMSVLQKSMEVQKDLGEMVVGLISNAALQTPGKAVGLGGKIDVFA